jgi:hypothetical protein
MTREEIDAVLERVRTWPLERQETAAALLVQLEDEPQDPYELSPEETADLLEAEAEIERGEVASDAEVKALFDRYRHP